MQTLKESRVQQRSMNEMKEDDEIEVHETKEIDEEFKEEESDKKEEEE